MPYLGQLRISTIPVFDHRHAIFIYPGLMFPQNFLAGAGGTHPPPNLGVSLKEKR
jgi:hypothetical protein